MPKVFISYVGENIDDVQRLVTDLKARDIDVWFNKTHLKVGEQFKNVIRREISQDDFFIACFSKKYNDRSQTYMNEELYLAIERMRQMHSDRIWILPVKLSECVIPDLVIRPGLILSDIQWVDLYKDWHKGIREIVRVINPGVSDLKNSINMEFILIPPGDFIMGTNSSMSEHEKPAHQIKISEPFYLGKYPVTQAQWQAVMGVNPSQFQGNPHHPVEQVSWNDVQSFIQKLNEREREKAYRLPTEAQWEYACRAGTERPRYGDVDAIAWYDENSDDHTHLVGEKLPNDWGLYDMLGNVWEWVQDWYDGSYYQYSPRVDPQGPDTGGYRVMRGGSWRNPEQYARADCRRAHNPIGQDTAANLGFRCSRYA
jgi:formylglycine-generating enzyme required for sulfatase activity